MTHMHPGLPFLFDDATENMVGVKQPNGGETFLMGAQYDSSGAYVPNPTSEAAHAAQHAGMGVGPSSASRYVGAIGDSITANCLTTSNIGVAIVSGGSGFVVNDSILMPNGVILNVTAVSGGAVTACSPINPGSFPYTTQGTVSQVWATGNGAGFSATLTKANGSTALMSKGYVGWAQTLSNCAGIFPTQLIWGWAGKGSLEILAVLPYFISALKAANCNTAVVEAPTNDLLIYGRSFSTTTAAMTQIYQSLVSAGIRVIAVPVLPRSSDGAGSQISTASARSFAAIAAWQARYCRDNVGMYLADPTMNIVDFSSTTGFPIPYTTISTGTAVANGYTMDGLHPSPMGAKWVGAAIASVLVSIMPPVDTRMVSPWDYYDSANNPKGNLLSNGMLQAFTGGLANSFSTIRYLGSAGTVTPTQASASLPNGSSYSKQQLDIATSTDTATGYSFYQTIYANFAAGDNVYAECEVDTSITGGQWSNIGLNLSDQNMTVRTLQEQANFNYNGSVAGGASWSGVLRTPPITVQAGATQVQFLLYLAIAGAGATGTVKIGRPALRKL